MKKTIPPTSTANPGGLILTFVAGILIGFGQEAGRGLARKGLELLKIFDEDESNQEEEQC